MTAKKLYAVFISSTYKDLVEERREVAETILSLEHLPVGMEYWPAADEDQFDFIKKVIDESDYYLVIVKGKYGSRDTDGISYTEKEFQYAVSRGLKVIALIHDNPDELKARDIEKDPETKAKLEAFKTQLGTGRLIRKWGNIDQLGKQAMHALTFATKNYPAVGWVRGNLAASDALAKENLRLKDENLTLRERAHAFPELPKDLAGLDDKIVLAMRTENLGGRGKVQHFTLTWRTIVSRVGPFILTPHAERSVMERLEGTLADPEGRLHDRILDLLPKLEQESADQVKVQLLALGLIRISTSKDNVPLWTLTDIGRNVLLSTNAHRKASTTTSNTKPKSALKK